MRFQATFLVLARKAHAIRNRDSVAGWLHGVARRVALRARADSARRQIKERRAANLAIAHAPAGYEAQGESWVELHEEIARLPERYREPIVLCYLEGLTTEAAAQRLGCPQGTVLSRLSRAKDRLRRSLTRRGVAEARRHAGGGLGFGPGECPCRRRLLETTVRASLNFAARHAVVEASLASTTAVGLARGVLYAMTLSQWKTIGAAILACVVAMGRPAGLRPVWWRGRGRPGRRRPSRSLTTTGKPPSPERSAKLQAELDESNRRNADLQKQLHAIEAELKALKANPTPTAVKKLSPSSNDGKRRTMPANRISRGMGGGLSGLRGDFEASGPAKFSIHTLRRLPSSSCLRSVARSRSIHARTDESRIVSAVRRRHSAQRSFP